MKLYLKALLWSLPIWILLTIWTYLTFPGGLDQLIGWLDFPGGVLVLLFSPSWQTMHNTDKYVFLIVNCFFYYGLFYLLFFLKKKLRS